MKPFIALRGAHYTVTHYGRGTRYRAPEKVLAGYVAVLGIDCSRTYAGPTGLWRFRAQLAIENDPRLSVARENPSDRLLTPVLDSARCWEALWYRMIGSARPLCVEPRT